MGLMEMFADPRLMPDLSMGEKMLGSLITMCMGMGITFVILVLLWVIIAVMNKIMNKSDRAGGTPQVTAPPVSGAAAQSVNAADDGALIAVIAAAIAAAEGTCVNNLVVRKIQRAAADLPSWAAAGTADCIESRKFC